jgi:polyketide synthase 7
VLVTGGTGAVGGHLARHLAERGAEHLVLTSRRGPDAPGAAELTADLEALGAKVTIEACDVADEKAVAELVARHDLSAVVHAAGVITAEAPALETTEAAFAEATRAKMAGAANLDRVLGDRPLDAFVLFASGAAIWGTAGRPAYATGNAYLDGLAQHRRARGLAATSIAWGSWAGGGMVDATASAALRKLGMSEMDPARALRMLDQVLADGESHLVVTDIDWARFTPIYTLARQRPLLRDLPEARTPEPEPVEDSGLATKLARLSEADQRRLLLDLVRGEAAAVLGHRDGAEVEQTRAFKDLGFDSVAAVDLRTRLSAATGLKLPATAVFDFASARALAGHLWDRLCESGTEPLAAELDRLAERVSGLDHDELERTRVVARLQAMVNAVTGVRGDGTVADRIAEAGTEDLFALIDHELGA